MSRNRKFKKKLKNMLVTVSTLLLIMGVSVGVTLALLWGKSNIKTNTFTGSKGVSVVLSEEGWDGSTVSTKGAPAAVLDPSKGVKMAENYTPKMSIPKDPIITNESEKEEVWVMMRVKYLISAKTTEAGDATKLAVLATEFNKLATTYYDASNAINPNWIPMAGNPTIAAADADGYYYYYYKTKLNKKGGSPVATEELFTQVKINPTIGWLETDETRRYQITPIDSNMTGPYYTFAILPEFDIQIEGAAISVEENDPANLDTAADGSGRTKNDIITALKGVFGKAGTSGS